MHYPAQRATGAWLALALSAACAASLAHAQSNVTLYGVVDVALAHVSNTNAAAQSATKIPSLTGSVPSRFGLRGSEDLGGGLAAVYALENGFSPDTGQLGQGGRLFGRQAWVGLRGAWGTLQLGRIPNMTFLALARSDVLGPNLFSISSIDLYLPNARSDNAIGYLGKQQNWVLGATYSLGRDASASGGPAATNCAGEQAADKRACRQYTALIGYEDKSFGMHASYDRLYGGSGAAFGLSSSAHHDTRSSLSGYYQWGATRFGAGWLARTTVASSGKLDSDLVFIGLSHARGAWTIDAQIARKDTHASADDSRLLAARASYALSPRSSVYAGAGHMSNAGKAAIALDVGGSIAPGQAQSGVMVGLRHSF